MENLIIRKATIDDCAGIQNIHRNCQDPWNEINECIAWLSKRLERDFYIQIAEINGQIVGHGEWIMDNNQDESFFYLGMLQIDEDYQRRGIGQKMIDDGIQMAKNYDCKKIITIPDQEKSVINFYKKCGFAFGRTIKSITLDTFDYGYMQRYINVDNVQFDFVCKKNFVFGLSQASARHMWEVYNNKPVSDDRIIKTLIAESGSCIQLGWFAEENTALVLYWNDFLNNHVVKDILTFGNYLGIKKISFRFFENYRYLFDQFEKEIKVEDVEIIKII